MNSHMKDVPLEMVDHIADDIDLSTLSALSCTQQSYNVLFSEKLSVLKQIKIELKLSNKQLSILYPLVKKPRELKEKYQKFSKYRQRTHEQAISLTCKYFLQDESNLLPLFICSMDDLSLFLEVSNPSLYTIYHELSLFMGCNAIPKHLYDITCKKYSQDNTKLLSYQNTILQITTTSGRLDLVQFLIPGKHQYPIKNLSNDLLYFAVESGNMELLQYYRNTHQLDIFADESQPISYINTAALHGHVEMFQHLLTLGKKIDKDTISCAAESGSIELVQYLVEKHKQKISGELLHHAIISGNKTLYMFLLDRLMQMPCNIEVDMSSFAQSNNKAWQYEVFAPWLRKRALYPNSQRAIHDLILQSGNLRLYRLASKLNSNFKNEFCNDAYLFIAAAEGHLKQVQTLLETSTLLPNESTINGAISSCHYALVKWLLDPTKGYYCQPLTVIEQLSQNPPILALVNSHQSFMRALHKTHITIHTTFVFLAIKDQVAQLLKESFEYNPEHAVALFQHVLLNPSHYMNGHLSKDAVFYVKNEFQTILSDMRKVFNPDTSPFVENIVWENLAWLKDHEHEINEAANMLANGSNHKIEGNEKNDVRSGRRR